MNYCQKGFRNNDTTPRIVGRSGAGLHLGQGWYYGHTLAGDFRAEVIKIEWPERLDSFRRNQNIAPPNVEPGPNAAGMFADQHVNKRGITLNVGGKHDTGSTVGDI